MYKMRSLLALPNLLILGATFGLLAVAQLGDAFAQSARSSDIYGATPLYQSSTVQSLGTLHSDDAGAARPVYNQPDSTDSVLQPLQVGDITYVTGGIGDEERDYLHNAAKNYNLHIANASSDGAYIGDTHIVIRNRKGDILLDAHAGPLFLAQLPAGSYTLEASHDGNRKKKTVGINRKISTVHFSW